MRRSGAPSQANPSKRPKFCVPFKATPCPGIKTESCSTVGTLTEPKWDNRLNPVREIGQNYDSVLQPSVQSSVSSPVAPITSQTNHSPTTVNSCVTPALVKPRFQSPVPASEGTHPTNTRFTVPAKQPQTPLVPIASAASQNAPGPEHGYFSVVWCKLSKKKHKKWEGDAVLVTYGRSVTLYDTEGKEIGKGTGYKSGELLTLKEDETLKIGGKEIQVMSRLTEEQFKSGKCFCTSGASNHSPEERPKAVPVNKPFCRPQKNTADPQRPVLTEVNNISVAPRFPVDTPGALVMPRPSQEHQWRVNKSSVQIVDVVLDPYLSNHLRPHQREGVVFLYECIMGYRNIGGHGAILADDMGLGKTLQCIALIWTLLKQGPYGGRPVVKKILIVTPGSLVKNWLQEFKKWLGKERLSVFAVSTDNRVEEFIKTSIYPVLIISYEMFVRAYDSIQQHIQFDLIVCDEGHRLKNTSIKTTSLIMSLPTRRRVVLTGTPIQNDLQEFFSIVEFCNPGLLGSSAGFRRVFEDPIVASRQPGATQEELELGDERAAELARLTKLFVLRRTQEINNKYLPPKSEIVLFCRPGDLQLQLYRQLLRCQVIRSCLAGRMEGAPHLICIAALKQLCNHPSLIYKKALQAEQDIVNDDTETKKSVYLGLNTTFPEGYDGSTTAMAEHSGKLGVLAALLENLHTNHPQEKIVLVSNHTKTLDMLQEFCEHQQYKCLRLDGQTPTARRQELVQRFNNKHTQDFIFLLSSKAGGVGLNLIGASRLVLYDIDWNPANDLQAMARVWRDGQRKRVYIYRLLTTGTIEEKMYQRQISKQGLSGAVMDVREKSSFVQFSLDDLKDLFSINETTDCDTHELLGCDCGQGTGSDTVDEVPAMVRPCQLGTQMTSRKKQRNLGMDELLAWKHLPGIAVRNFESWCLTSAVDHISYAFYCDVKTEDVK